MQTDTYIQHNNGDIYKVMDKYLLKISPWKDGTNRRVYEYDDNDMHIITYQNAMMIVNKQFAETTEEWEHKGKQYKAHPIVDRSADEYAAMLSMLPSHYIKESVKTLQTLPNGNSISISDHKGNEFKMVKHKGKICFALIINEYLPRVQIHDTFGKFCQWVNIKNLKPIYNATDKKYI